MWAKYRKFVVAGVGALLAVLNVFALDQTLSANTLHWVTTAIAVITALAVYIVPNDPA